MTTAPTIARSIVVKASCRVAGKARSAIVGGGLAGAQRGAEVEVDDALEVVDELRPHRLVEAVGLRRTPRAVPAWRTRAGTGWWGRR